jgi:hypothetical protein
VIHYLALLTPYALAVVSGRVDTIPLWAAPPEGVMGTRVALFASGWHEATAMGLTERDGVRFGTRDRLRSGRVGSVMVMGYVETAHPWDRKGIAGKNWPGRPVPKRMGTFHWLVGQPKVEINQSVLGLSRLPVAYMDRVQQQAALREYGDKHGPDRLPSEDRELYLAIVRKDQDVNPRGK